MAYDTWHSIEIYATVGNGVAAVGLWINGIQKAIAEGFTNDNYAIESVMAGCL